MMQALQKARVFVLGLCAGCFVIYFASTTNTGQLPLDTLPSSLTVTAQESQILDDSISALILSAPLPAVLLVLSHFRDDVDWLLQSPIPYVLMTHELGVHRPHNVINRPGREPLAYLQFIIEHYHALPDVMIFAHAHRNSWHINVWRLWVCVRKHIKIVNDTIIFNVMHSHCNDIVCGRIFYYSDAEMWCVCVRRERTWYRYAFALSSYYHDICLDSCFPCLFRFVLRLQDMLEVLYAVDPFAYEYAAVSRLWLDDCQEEWVLTETCAEEQQAEAWLGPNPRCVSGRVCLALCMALCVL
jgi:hypothetical protein